MKRFDANGATYTVVRTTAETTGFGAYGRGAVAATTSTAPKTTAAKNGLYRKGIKRGLDAFLILLSLPFTVPVIGLCAIALWLEGGSPFYTQPRLGRDGKTFRIFKLRSMVQNADQVLESYLAKDPEMRREWDDLQKLRNDPRITPLGAIIRATSIDELPQLFNVLIGDMSLVGPRPMMPDQAPLYGDMKDYNAVRPGITGLWQVSARNESGFAARKAFDATYNQSLTFWNDLKVIFKTVGVVCRRTGM